MKKIVLLTVMLMPLLLYACRESRPAAAPIAAPNDSTAIQNAFTFRYQEEIGTVTAENEVSLYRIFIRYPLITYPLTDGTATVNAALTSLAEAAMKATVPTSSSNNSYGSDAVCRVNVSPCRADSALISLRAESSFNFADAPEISGITFSTQSGDKLNLSDIFKDWDASRAVVGNELRHALATQAQQKGLGAPDWEIINIAIAEDTFGWYIGTDDFVALFAAEAVACDHSGTVTATIPLTALYEHLNTDYFPPQQSAA